MSKVSPKLHLTFDDVLIQPKYSDIETRRDIELVSEFLGMKLHVPIISANMDYITGSAMAVAMWGVGGLGILHRFSSWEQQKNEISIVHNETGRIGFSVGIRNLEESISRIREIEALYANYANQKIVCIDVAHGHHSKVITLIKHIRDKFLDWKIIAGNVATVNGFYDLAISGADAVKIGIGPGSVCTTRTVTGVGIPQLSAILEIDEYRQSMPSLRHVRLIADGGIKNSGDIVKAIGAGADVVMLGRLLAGTEETPAPTYQGANGIQYREYRGQSIFGINGAREVPEGISGYVESKGPVHEVIRRLAGGLRSGMSYVGASTLAELQQNCEFIPVTSLSQIETGTRL